MTTEKNYSKWYFLAIVILGYIITFFVNPEKTYLGLNNFVNIFLKVIPVILLVIILMTVTNYFIKPKQIAKYLGKKSGWKGWTIAIISGTLSTGPIYIWYPLLNDLQKHKIRNGLIATFLYTRSIKIPLIPLIIVYFGITYTIILTITIIIISIVQGWTTEKLMEIKI